MCWWEVQPRTLGIGGLVSEPGCGFFFLTVFIIFFEFPNNSKQFLT